MTLRHRFTENMKYFLAGILFFCVIYYFQGSEKRTNLQEEMKEFNKKFQNGFPRQKIRERLSRKSFFDPKLILFYTEFFGTRPWKRHFVRENLKCRMKIPCHVSFDPERFVDSHAVIFHLLDIKYFEELRMLNAHPIRSKQIWIIFTMENPLSAIFNPELDDLFNFTMSYRAESDFRFSYGYYYPRKEPADQLRTVPTPKVNFAVTKSKQVAWLVSNCGKFRDSLVQKLEKNSYITTYVGGKCSKYYKNQLKCKGHICNETLSEHKFYLAFENSFCPDYVTEKYWFHPIQNHMIPIVLGGANYKDPKLAIPGSFIDVFDFKSPKHLMDYILEIDYDDTLFNSYFDWRNKYEFFSEDWECHKAVNDICTKMNTDEFLNNDFSALRKAENRTISKELNDKEACYAREWLFKMWLHKK
ncbi:4-galactosyl-N-acetylglucosaminide 3-alpha-L-fucosyltransferase FUT6-like [Clytia hemisphaerica]|uniref:4-galactosyl-N-acetylglucosaminide 3-alpha-L-fucosyltransferase FUT6-like n=1 Tax=Clytia hemisphaerica TaxID=252671 RepID=UPI0034D67ED3